jgi:hypothetical protein
MGNHPSTTCLGTHRKGWEFPTLKKQTVVGKNSQALEKGWFNHKRLGNQGFIGPFWKALFINGLWVRQHLELESFNL